MGTIPTNSPTVRRRGPSWDKAVIDQARALRRAGFTYGEIKTRLDPKSGPLGIPESTIKYWTRGVRQDASGAWCLWEAAAATIPDPSLLVRWLGAVRWATGGRVRDFTNAEARWITLLVGLDAYPKSAFLEVYSTARAFIEAETTRDDLLLSELQEIVVQSAAGRAWPDVHVGDVYIGADGQLMMPELPDQTL